MLEVYRTPDPTVCLLMYILTDYRIYLVTELTRMKLFKTRH